MTTLPDNFLLQNGERARSKVVIITGGARGIGKEVALLFARYKAKIVIGDLAFKEGDALAEEITRLGGQAVSARCDVLDWDTLVDLFELAISRFGAVDFVIPVAGITEQGNVCSGVVQLQNGRPMAPNYATLDVNLKGVLNTVHLALHYFRHNRQDKSNQKALVLMGSMAAWEAIPLTPLYASSKHGVLGLMRSIYPLLERDNIRIGCVDSWFADTGLIPFAARVVLAGSPLTPVHRIAHTVLAIATDPDPASNGCPWLLPDEGPVLRLEREHLTAGAYGRVNSRIAALRMLENDIKLKTVKDILKIFGWKFYVFFTLVFVTGAWKRFRQ